LDSSYIKKAVANFPAHEEVKAESRKEERRSEEKRRIKERKEE